MSLHLIDAPHVLLLHALSGSQVSAILWCNPPPTPGRGTVTGLLFPLSGGSVVLKDTRERLQCGVHAVQLFDHLARPSNCSLRQLWTK